MQGVDLREPITFSYLSIYEYIICLLELNKYLNDEDGKLSLILFGYQITQIKLYIQ